ncbi:MAG: Omp28-related outer membrane protein [Salibacteraceae bacterium]
MKKFTFLGAALLAGFSMSAQTFVSTTPANKNAVVEEYTGIRCVFCPDGHKRGNALAAANPGRVVLINIHTGSYAVSQNGSIDFTTTEGDAIATHPNVKLTGYPAGSVNRVIGGSPSNGGTASSRGQWATDAATIMGQSSPVNADVQASYDINTNEVTAVVEVYYTGTQTVTSNMLSVAILENKVIGPQTGGATYYPEQMNPDGTYNHNHMLRAMLTPAFGEPINTITSGSFFTKTYTWTVPANLKGVPVKFQDLKVAVFVAEDQQTILTGAETKVELPASIVSDLSATDMSTKPTSMCSHSYTPSLEIENMENNTVTSFDMSYTVNGGTPVVQSYSGSLAKGAKTTITWPMVNLPAGSVNSIAFSGPSNINGGSLIDVDGSNNSIASSQFIAVGQKAITAGLSEDFENVADIDNLPTNWFKFLEPGSSDALESRVYVNNTVGSNTSARGKAIWYSTSWGTAGDKVSVMIGEVDGDKVKDAAIKFSYASAMLNANSNDGLSIMVSKDCGNTWASLWSKSGNDLSPFGTDNSAILVPSAESNWNDATVPLQVEGDLLVKVVVTAGGGNSMWLDDIQIYSATSVNNIASVSNIKTYPNPVNNNLSIDINADNASDMDIRVLDITGKVVIDLGSNRIETGMNTISVNTSSLETGVYNVHISSNEGSEVKRIIVE